MTQLLKLFVFRHKHVRCMIIKQSQCYSSKKRSLRSNFYYDKYIKNKDNSKRIRLWRSMSISDVANALQIPLNDVFNLILDIPGTEYLENENQSILRDYVFTEFAAKLRFKLELIPNPNLVPERKKNVFEDLEAPLPNSQALIHRSPVIAIMGHIDHGKTTLLDHLRNSHLADSEHGGITQHVSAFSVTFAKNKMTFVDTPGHAAFKKLRYRGACLTDIVLLVIDASEGVLEQTKESLRMIRESRTPFIVVCNKIDKENARIEDTKLALKDLGVNLEEFGGQVPFVPISAKYGTNIEELKATIVTLAEVLELIGDPTGAVVGIVMESFVHQGLGKIAHILINKGVLQRGQILTCGTTYGKVKRILGENGEERSEASLSDVVKVVGWKELPFSGEIVIQVPNEKKAGEITEGRRSRNKENNEAKEQKTIEDKREKEREIYTQQRREALKNGQIRKISYKDQDCKVNFERDETPKVNLIIKADVNGSLEAILDVLDTYSDNERVKLDIFDFGVGDVTMTDVNKAHQFNCHLYSFNLPVKKELLSTANELEVPFKNFNVIYDLIRDVKEEINFRIRAEDSDVEEGRGRVLQEFLVTFEKSKHRVAGITVISGRIKREHFAKILRASTILSVDCKILSLKHKKQEENEINVGKECGLILTDKNLSYVQGDEIIFYSKKERIQETSWEPGF